MLKSIPGILVTASVLVISSCQEKRPPTEQELRVYAAEMAAEWIIIDTHIDVPYRLVERMEDISVRTAKGDFDYPRAKQGGLDGAFMSVYVPASYESGGAKGLADSLIDMVNRFCTDWPEKFHAAHTVAEIIANHENDLISLPMGMENGSPLEGRLENLRYFFDRGIRYITLAHSKNNHICDSSYEPEPKWGGLSPFGREVVQEMNRLGMMIDVSHISDSAFSQVIRLSRSPVIASHSSCRSFTPGWQRNMSDEMIRSLAQNGGVIQINFGSAFLTDDLRNKWTSAWGEIRGYLEEHHLKLDSEEAEAYIKEYRKERDIGYADISDVIAHIDHVVKLVGPDHVGFGSDFDGVGDSLPDGLKDVSMYPNLVYEMMKLGYPPEDIQKICGGNLLRVWKEVEDNADRITAPAGENKEHG